MQKYKNNNIIGRWLWFLLYGIIILLIFWYRKEKKIYLVWGRKHSRKDLMILKLKRKQKYYKVESYILAYADPIYLIPAEEFWNLSPKFLGKVIPPPEKKTKQERKRMKHVPTIGEAVSKKRNKCSPCKRFGHKKITCPTRSNLVAETSNGVVSWLFIVFKTCT